MDRSSVYMSGEGEEITLKFSGPIDETVKFIDIRLPSSTRQLVLDLGQVSILNSSGLRAWVLWVRSLEKRIGVFFRNCPMNVISQMNILDGFVPMGAIVDSFQVPYFCESCKRETLKIAVRGKDFVEATSDTKSGILIKEFETCPHCKATMQWDVVPEIYFKFLKPRR